MSEATFVLTNALLVVGIITVSSCLIAMNRGRRVGANQVAILLGLFSLIATLAVASLVLPAQPAALLAGLAIGWIVIRTFLRIAGGTSAGDSMVVAVIAASLAIALGVGLSIVAR